MPPMISFKIRKNISKDSELYHKSILKITDALFETVPYSKESEELKEKIISAFQTEYQTLVKIENEK